MPTDRGLPADAPSRRQVLAVATGLSLAALAGCGSFAPSTDGTGKPGSSGSDSPGSGGSGSGSGGPGGSGSGGSPSGHIVVKGDELFVVDAATGTAVRYPAASTLLGGGVGVSRNGYIADVWDYNGTGSNSWKIAIRTLAGGLATQWTVGGSLASPRGAAVLDAGATRLACSLNELPSPDGERLDRTYVYDTKSGSIIARISDRLEPAFADTGDLFLRAGDRLHVYDESLADGGPLPISVPPRDGAYSVSPNARYVAFEDGRQLHVLDRTTGSTWAATASAGRTSSCPVFSPDGKWLAFLHDGGVALRYLHVIPFRPGTTVTITENDGTELTGPDGRSYPGSGRIGWAT